jgi:hypothetical protein
MSAQLVFNVDSFVIDIFFFYLTGLHTRRENEATIDDRQIEVGREHQSCVCLDMLISCLPHCLQSTYLHFHINLFMFFY